MLFRELIRDGKHYPQALTRWPEVGVDNLDVVNEMDRDLTSLSRVYLLTLRTVNIATADTDRPLNVYLAKGDAADRRLQYPSFHVRR